MKIPEQVQAHNCTLPAKEEVIVGYIKSGYMVNLRRKVKKLMLASEKLPQAMAYLKSPHIIQREQIRHLSRYYYSIHPYSKFILYWSIFQIVVHLCCFCSVPFYLSSYGSNAAVIMFSIDLLFCADMVVHFFTGYYSFDKNQVVLNLGKIAKHYLITTFFTDLLSSVGSLVVNFVQTFWRALEETAMSSSWKWLLFAKLFRLYNLLQYIYFAMEYFQISKYKIKAVSVALVSIIFIEWYSCMSIILQHMDGAKPSDEDNLNPLVKIMHGNLLLILQYGTTEKALPWEKTSNQLLFDVLTSTIGLLIYIGFLAYLMQLTDKYLWGNNKQNMIYLQLVEYCQFKGLNEKLSREILQYYAFKYQNSFFREDHIMNTVNKQLREGIAWHLCYDLVSSCNFFADIPPTIFTKLIMKMVSIYFLTGDIVVRAGDVGDGMYFIVTGSVAVYDKFGAEVCHLIDGAHFGEVSIILSAPIRVATVVAIEPCEMYLLTRTVFEKLFKQYPELLTRMKNIVLDKYSGINEKLRI